MGQDLTPSSTAPRSGATPRPFRFGVGLVSPAEIGEWRRKCRRAEALGYDVIHAADHLGMPAPFPSPVAAAEATERPRLGTFTVNAGFWNPVLLAREIATTDQLTGGRLELGLGAGYAKAEHDAAGLPFGTPGERVSHLLNRSRRTRHIAFSAISRYAAAMTSAPEDDSFVPKRAESAPDRAPAVRASDAERDEVAAVLSEALAQGRLTSAELAERIDAAYSATTRAELVPLTADLPDDLRKPGAPALAAVERQELDATFSKVIRTGRWVAGRHTSATARFGALIVNLSEAVLPGREITLDINTFCGKAIITVPENARIVDEGGALFGKRSVTSGTAEAGEDGPLIRITGRSRFGKIVVRRSGGADRYWWHQG